MEKLNFLTQLVSFSIAALASQLSCVTTSAAFQDEFSVSVPGGVIQAQIEWMPQQGGYPMETIFVRSISDSGVVLWEKEVAWGYRAYGAPPFYFCDFDVDQEGNLFLCGYVMEGWMAFGDGEDDEHITVYDSALVIVKLAPGGESLWVNKAWYPNWECPTELALDPEGNAYAIWSYDMGWSCRVSSTSGEVELPPLENCSRATVLARFSPSGALDWIVRDENWGGSQLMVVKKHRISVILGNSKVEFNDHGKLISRKKNN